MLCDAEKNCSKWKTFHKFLDKVLFYNQWTKRNNPKECVSQVVKPHHIEQNELTIVSLSDTGAHPNTIMIIAHNANVALRTMDTIRWLPYFTSITKSILSRSFWGFVARNFAIQANPWIPKRYVDQTESREC